MPADTHVQVTARISQWLRDAGRDRTEGELLLLEAHCEIDHLRAALALRVPRHVHDAEIAQRDEVIAQYRRNVERATALERRRAQEAARA